MTHLYTTFHLKMFMYDRGIERKLYTIRQTDGRTERANTICPMGTYKSQRVTFDEISLKTMWKSPNFAAQKDRSMIVFLGWSVNKDDHPSLWLASTFVAKLRSKTCLWNGNVCQEAASRLAASTISAGALKSYIESRSWHTLGSWTTIAWNIIHIMSFNLAVRSCVSDTEFGYVYTDDCDLDLGDRTLCQGHGTPLGHGQQLCEILSRSSVAARSYSAYTDFGYMCTTLYDLEDTCT